MKIAFLGSSSQIAKGLLREFHNDDKHHFYLFTRDTESFNKWINSAKLNSPQVKLESFEKFNSSHEFDLIINFIGIGDPAKALKMGSKIFDITYEYDQLVLDYLTFHPNTKYIFISSGVVYGDIFKSPARDFRAFSSSREMDFGGMRAILAMTDSISLISIFFLRLASSVLM